MVVQYESQWRVSHWLCLKKKILYNSTTSETGDDIDEGDTHHTKERYTEQSKAAQWRPLLNGQFGEWDPR
jgi:hypothetical protein